MTMRHQFLCPLALPVWTLFLLTVIVATVNGIVGVKGAIIPQEEEGDSDTNNKFGTLVAWVRQNGGRVDSRLGLTNHNHGGRIVRGGVALQPIEAGSELLFLPWKIVLGTVGDTATVPENSCEVLQNYASEVEAGYASFWHPYLALDGSLSSEVGRVPSLWSNLAISELQGLPPFGSTGGLTDWFSSNCADGVPFSDLPSSSRQALLAAITRAAGMRFLPIYDLLNHHNGLLNTKSHADVKGDTITITRDIAKGEEIFMSYRGGKETTVSEIFRRYGFVESWPQYWCWTGQDDTDDGMPNEVQFLLLPDDTVAIYPPDSILSQIGHTSLHLDTLLASTEKHNKGLSIEQLVQFSQAGHGLISSLNTTAEEDLVLLHKIENVLSQNLDSGETEQLRDLISVVDYRMHFKESIQTAIEVAEHLLTLRRSKGEL